MLNKIKCLLNFHSTPKLIFLLLYNGDYRAVSQNKKK